MHESCLTGRALCFEGLLLEQNGCSEALNGWDSYHPSLTGGAGRIRPLASLLSLFIESSKVTLVTMQTHFCEVRSLTSANRPQLLGKFFSAPCGAAPQPHRPT